MHAQQPIRFVADGWLLLAIAFAASWAVALGVIHHLGSSGPPDSGRSSVAFATAFLAPAAVALAGTVRARPWLLGMAGASLIPMAVISIVGFPMMAPAAVFMAKGFGRASADPRGVMVGVAAAALAVCSLAALIVHQDPASWQTATGSAGSSNIITGTEVAVSLGLALGAMAIAWLAQGPAGVRRA